MQICDVDGNFVLMSQCMLCPFSHWASRSVKYVIFPLFVKGFSHFCEWEQTWMSSSLNRGAPIYNKFCHLWQNRGTITNNRDFVHAICTWLQDIWFTKSQFNVALASPLRNNSKYQLNATKTDFFDFCYLFGYNLLNTNATKKFIIFYFTK